MDMDIEYEATTGQHNLDEHLARLYRMMRRRPAGGRHVSQGGRRLLAIVLQEDGIRTSELAERLDIRPSSLSEVLKRLEEEGYLTRSKDEQDSRVSHFHATTKAREAYGRPGGGQPAAGSRLQDCLSEEELRAFCATCDKLCEFLESDALPEHHAGHHHGHHAEHHAGQHHGQQGEGHFPCPPGGCGKAKCKGDGCKKYRAVTGKPGKGPKHHGKHHDDHKEGKHGKHHGHGKHKHKHG